MIQLTHKQLAAIVAVLALVWWTSGGNSQPQPGPQPVDRPVLRWIARAAKNCLWIALVAEGPPADTARAQVVHARVGEDGYQAVDHGRGW
jgi:hypothetical protein